MDGVGSVAIADANVPPHWTTLNPSRKAEIAYAAIFYLAALSVITPKDHNLG